MTPSIKPTVTLSGARGDEWFAVLGTRRLAILSPVGAMLPIEDHEPLSVLCVMLDVDELDDLQREKLISHMARKFGTSSEEAARDVLSRGVPIRLGPDARIDVPPGWKTTWKSVLEAGARRAIDIRFFT